MKKFALAVCNVALIASMMLGAVATVSAQTAGQKVYTNPTQGLGDIKLGTGAAGNASLPTIISNILNVLFGVLGIVAVLLVIYSGWQWMTGGPDGVKAAKTRMLNAAVGLLLILTAYAITNYVITALTSATTGTAQ